LIKFGVKKIMYGIMLVNQAGETVASVGWDTFEGDVTMFGGFVSAVQMFIKRIANGTQVEELRFGNMKLLIGNSNDYHVITLHEANEPGAESENQEIVELVRENNGNFNDGSLALACELISKDKAAIAQVGESVKVWTQSEADKAKKSALDWGKAVL
jgi:serine/threonine protein phosphatase PrpC